MNECVTRVVQEGHDGQFNVDKPLRKLRSNMNAWKMRKAQEQGGVCPEPVPFDPRNTRTWWWTIATSPERYGECCPLRQRRGG